MGEPVQRTAKEEQLIGEVTHVIQLFNVLLSKKGLAGLLAFILIGGSGGGFLANFAHTVLGPPVNIEITSSQMHEMITLEMIPIAEVVQDLDRICLEMLVGQEVGCKHKMKVLYALCLPAVQIIVIHPD